MDLGAKAGVKRVITEVTVTRADGTVQNYGAVADSSAGPIRRWLAERRIRRLNREAHRRNPEVPV